MIDPQVEHGGASSWFWMAAKPLALKAEAIPPAGGAGASAVALTSSASCSGVDAV